MNKVKEKLKKYFSENDIDKLLEKLESKQRSFLINNNYFVKIGKNSNKFFFDNLIKEIDIYKNNRGNQNLPNLIDLLFALSLGIMFSALNIQANIIHSNITPIKIAI